VQTLSRLRRRLRCRRFPALARPLTVSASHRSERISPALRLKAPP
jgi:hypothetical protein